MKRGESILRSDGMRRTVRHAMWLITLGLVLAANAQTPPSGRQIANYQGLHRAAHSGDMDALEKALENGADIEARDASGRTPLHVAAYASQNEIVRALAKAGADMDALEHRAYDIVTIAAVANDLAMVDLALDLGASAASVTSPYDGTALIAAAHLGHYEVVQRLIEGGAPLDHINNLGWTALIEAVVLGDGGENHVRTARALVKAGARTDIADRNGKTPLELARTHGFDEIASVIESATK